MFGAGGGTSAYIEAEDADLLVLWGSNARETHPIFFHHVLQGLKKALACTRSTRGARPRRSGPTPGSALDVGTDIALANAIGREIIHAGLVNEAFVRSRHHRFRGLPGDRRAVHRSSARRRSPASTRA